MKNNPDDDAAAQGSHGPDKNGNRKYVELVGDAVTNIPEVDGNVAKAELEANRTMAELEARRSRTRLRELESEDFAVELPGD